MKRDPSWPSGMIKRGRVYYASFRFRGELIRKSLSSDLAVAKEMLAELRHKLYRHSIGDISNDYPLETLFKEWIKSISQKSRQSTVLRNEQHLNHIIRLIGDESVVRLNYDVIEEFRYLRLQENVGEREITPQTVNKDVAALSNMLNWAVERKKIGSNPIAGISKLPEYAKESRALEPEEVSAILKCSSEHWRRVWYAYFVSGTRKMELANSLFTDVDWKSKELVIRASNSKSRKWRSIPLDDRLYDIVVMQKERAANRQAGRWSGTKTNKRIRELFTKRHIFATTANTPLGGNIYREFMAACKRANIATSKTTSDGQTVEFVSLHSTRHTFASNLILNGADPRSVQYLLGHRTLDMTMKIYAKLFDGQRRSAISKLSIANELTFADG